MTPLGMDKLIAGLLKHEGGIADIGDGAGTTRWGQTPTWLAQYALPAPTTPQEATTNYQAWLSRTRLDRLPDALAEPVVDFAVNSGTVVAIKALQHALLITEDGLIGPQTLGMLRRLTINDYDQIVRVVTAVRLRLLGRYVAANPQFAAGLLNRVADVLEGV